MTEQSDSNLKSKVKFVERITIEERFWEKLASLTNQANDSFQGMARVSKSDVINFMLQMHGDDFSVAELKELRGQHFNEIKFSQWVTAQLKKAQANGEQVNLKDLFERNLNLLEGSNPQPRQRRQYRRKQKEKDSEQPAEPIKAEDAT